MADDNSPRWNEYYQMIEGREPRELLLDVLEKFPSDNALQAIDLGCGDGTETVELLSRGWHVLAVDGASVGIKRLLKKVPPEKQAFLQTAVVRFEDVTLPPADLIHASYSLPFCPPDQFPAFWKKISNALNPGGRFAGQFFGVRDTWADIEGMTFHTQAQVRTMLVEYETEYFHEVDEAGEAAAGPKHWHKFIVIARKVAI